MFLNSIYVTFNYVYIQNFESHGTIINTEKINGLKIQNTFVENSKFNGLLESESGKHLNNNKKTKNNNITKFNIEFNIELFLLIS